MSEGMSHVELRPRTSSADATKPRTAATRARNLASSSASSLPLTSDLLHKLTSTAHKSGKQPRAWAADFGYHILKMTTKLRKHGAIPDWQDEAKLFFEAMSGPAKHRIIQFARKSGVAAVERDGRRGIKIPGTAAWMLRVLETENATQGPRTKHAAGMVGVEHAPLSRVVAADGDSAVRARAQAASRNVAAKQWARRRLSSLSSMEFSKAASFKHTKTALLKALVAGSPHAPVHLVAVARAATGSKFKSTHAYSNRLIEDVGRASGGQARRSFNECPMPVNRLPFFGPDTEAVAAEKLEEAMDIDIDDNLVSSPGTALDVPAPSSSTVATFVQARPPLDGPSRCPSLIVTPPSPTNHARPLSELYPTYSPNHLAPPSRNAVQTSHQQTRSTIRSRLRIQELEADAADLKARRRRSPAPEPEFPHRHVRWAPYPVHSGASLLQSAYRVSDPVHQHQFLPRGTHGREPSRRGRAPSQQLHGVYSCASAASWRARQALGVNNFLPPHAPAGFARL